MRLTLTEARSRLGELCTLAQDPRHPIVLTRHGRPLAALVSIAEVKRIWDLESDQRFGMRHILNRRRGSRTHTGPLCAGTRPELCGAFEVRSCEKRVTQAQRMWKKGVCH